MPNKNPLKKERPPSEAIFCLLQSIRDKIVGFQKCRTIADTFKPCQPATGHARRPRRQAEGGTPTVFLNARLKAASDP